jgi:transposase
MTMREVDRLKVIEAVAECRLKPGQAADRLSLSVRQVERLVLRYRAAGVAGLVSGKRGRPSNHQLPAGKAQRALALIRERYADFGPTLACEKLCECHGIRLAKETVRKLMTGAGLWIPRRQRPPKVYQPRARRACRGELSVSEFATTGVGQRLRGIEPDHGLVNQDEATGRKQMCPRLAHRPARVTRSF